MKKFFYIFTALLVMIGIASCSSIRHTSTTVDVGTTITSVSTAELTVSPTKISFNYYPTKAVRRCGEKAVIETAVSEALKANDNADVLVGFQYEIKKTKNFFGKVTIKYVIVKGYPATYTEFSPVKNK